MQYYIYIVMLLYILTIPTKLSRCTEDYGRYYPNLFKGVILRGNSTLREWND